MGNIPGLITVITILGLLAVLLSDRVRPVFAFLGALGILFLLQILSPVQALSGLANPVIATLALLFIINRAVEKTGILNDAVRFTRTGRSFGSRPLMILLLMLPVAAFSSVLNNTPLVLMLVPAVKGWGRKQGVPGSRLLIPLSYAAIVGGMWTIIGTSTNLLVNDLYRGYSGGTGLLFFEPGIIGIPLTLAAVLYMAFLGQRLLPDYSDAGLRFVQRSDEYLIELLVPRGSILQGRNLEDAGLRGLPDVYLSQIFRGDDELLISSPQLVLMEGDRLVFAGDIRAAEELAREKHLVPGDPESLIQDTRKMHDRLVELAVRDDSRITNKSIRQIGFRNRYHGVVLAVHRKGQKLSGRIGDIRLREGDTLLVLTAEEDLPRFESFPEFYLLSRRSEVTVLRPWQRWLVYLGVTAMIGLSTLSTMGIIVGFMGRPLGLLHFAFILAGVLFVTGTINTRDMRESLRFDLLLIIASAIGIALALEETGIAERIGERLMFLTRSLTPLGILAVVFLVTNLITEFITNNAAAVLLFPIVMAVGESMGIDQRALVMVLMVAAGSSFSTPMGYQTNLIVQSAAGYRFRDFLRVGLPMNFIAFLVTMVMVRLVYL